MIFLFKKKNVILFNITSILLLLWLQDSGMNGEHVWVDTNTSGDFCYVGETDCSVSSAVSNNFFKLCLFSFRICQTCEFLRQQAVLLGSGQGGRVIFFQTLEGGLIFAHASLANIFNKCYKKAIFMKNN